MSYLRPLNLQPDTLRQCALDSWLRHLLQLIRDNQIIARGKPLALSPSYHLLEDCLKVLVNYSSSAVQHPSQQHTQHQHQVFHCRGRPILLNLGGLSSYLDSLLPCGVQEDAFHRGALLLRQGKEAASLYFDVFPFFFCLLWRREFKTLDLPPIADQEDRIAVLDHLANRCSFYSDDDCEDDGESDDGAPTTTFTAFAHRTETAKFRLFESCELSIEESYLTKRALRGLGHLRTLVLWWGADDPMLSIVGSVCRRLESADFWRSAAVTDLGVKMLLLSDDDASERGDGRSPLCSTLKRLGLKETSCTHVGCLAAAVACPGLEVLTFSHTAVVKDFFSGVRYLISQDRKRSPPIETQFSLKTLFLPVTDGSSFSEIVSAFPRLEDLRLWTTAGRLALAQHGQEEKYPPLLPNLHSLLLGGLHSGRVLRELVGAVGKQLTTLKLETVLTDIPLQLVGEQCTNLVELQVTNGRLVVGREHCCSGAAPSFLSKLKLVYLFLVQYVPRGEEEEDEDERRNRMNAMMMRSDDESSSAAEESEGEQRMEVDVRRRPASDPPASALHCILHHATLLEGLQATGCPSFDDVALKEVMQVNPLKKLKRFVMTDAALQSDPSGTSLTLTSSSALLLFDRCPLLQCLGDLRHWDVSPKERRNVVLEVQRRTGTKWISTPSH